MHSLRRWRWWASSSQYPFQLPSPRQASIYGGIRCLVAGKRPFPVAVVSTSGTSLTIIGHTLLRCDRRDVLGGGDVFHSSNDACTWGTCGEFTCRARRDPSSCVLDFFRHRLLANLPLSKRRSTLVGPGPSLRVALRRLGVDIEIAHSPQIRLSRFNRARSSRRDD
jgi:hypothetical protein